MERYHVRVSSDDLFFSAAHFITFRGGECERLHGHDFRVAAELEGRLDENQYVVDFLALRDTLKAILAENLDHRVLLPTGHPLIRIVSRDREVEVTFADRRWVFPRGDCVQLPISNTTTELLARYIGTELLTRLLKPSGASPVRMRIEVEESYGQSACYERDDFHST